MRPSETLRANRSIVISIAAQMGMANVRVFGSVLHGSDTDDSDIDLLVDAPDNATLLDMVALQNAIESQLGCTVDVLTADDLPVRFRNSVLAEAMAL
ncbi:MAG: nucleotidyltransferase family protein [Sulfuritalea sp.]|jgi:predicted nucleotidyltransferase|nr:nucleotidyltransferase family protein [Sulfuritalea sp.]